MELDAATQQGAWGSDRGQRYKGAILDREACQPPSEGRPRPAELREEIKRSSTCCGAHRGSGPPYSHIAAERSVAQ